MSNYQDVNSKIIDKWVEDGWEWGKAISSEKFNDVKNGKWEVVLTPLVPVPHVWFGNLKGKKVLGLASGGGQQMPVFAALGAICTVLDYSDKQLESERIVAERENYKINIIKADMSKKFPFNDNEFDLIFHPVSNCYVKNVNDVFKECYRVLKKGGILLSGLDNAINFIVNSSEKKVVTKMPFDPTLDKKLYKKSIKKNWGIQFSHTLEEQIGGQLKAGFTLTDLYEDTNGNGHLHNLNIKTFLATRSVK